MSSGTRAVLNAFRHHGQGNGRGDVGVGVCGRAQRLSASRPGEQPTKTRKYFAKLCSTPFGITARGTAPARRGKTPHLGAQRLSASRPGEPFMRRATSSVCSCSTPFGITARGTADPQYQEFFPVKCSTPFGITARGTQEMKLGVNLQLKRCSTPFGITARGT